MNRPVKLSVIRDDRKRAAAKAVKSRAFMRLREMVADAGDNLAGFVMMTWDAEGYVTTVIHPGKPFPSRIVPVVAAELLKQHGASDLAEGEIKKILWPSG